MRVPHVDGCTGSPPTVGCDACIFTAHAPRSIRRRRTAQLVAMLQAGVHPATERPLDRAHRCGDCTHCVAEQFATKTDHHCDVARYPQLRIRLSWPACDAFQGRPAASGLT